MSLGILWTLANIDKHREQLPLWWGIGNTSGAPDEVGGHQTDGASIPDAPMTAGFLFAEWRFADGMPDRLEESLVEKYLPIRLRISNTAFSWPTFDIHFATFDFEEVVKKKLCGQWRRSSTSSNQPCDRVTIPERSPLRPTSAGADRHRPVSASADGMIVRCRSSLTSVSSSAPVKASPSPARKATGQQRLVPGEDVEMALRVGAHICAESSYPRCHGSPSWNLGTDPRLLHSLPADA